jgi:hypothetical protein
MLDACEIRPRKDNRGVDLISDALPFGRLGYGEPNAISNAIGDLGLRRPGTRRLFDLVERIEKRGRRRIRTAEYWRAYYTRKQREWRAAHPRKQSSSRAKEPKR